LGIVMKYDFDEFTDYSQTIHCCVLLLQLVVSW